MNTLHALYFDGRSALSQRVTLQLEAGKLVVSGDESGFSADLASVRLSPRLGRTRRQLSFADGGICELDDDALLDVWFNTSAQRRWNFLARLEAHWGIILIAAALVISLMASLAVWGMPWLAQKVAISVPEEWVQQLGKGTLSGLDKAFGGDSQLPAARQQDLHRQFSALARAANVRAHFQFRDWPRLGPNALALPDGSIVITDQLVALADDDRELLAVVAHELGHVHERHALQKVLSGSGVAVIVFVLTGDVSGLSSIVIAAPTLLTHLHHSRALEADADSFAFALMQKQGLDPAWFARIIRKLEKGHVPEDRKAEADGPGDWLRSHPASEERARQAELFRAAP